MKKSSLSRKMIFLFCITSILPILVLSIYSYYSSVTYIRENSQDLSDINVKQMDDNLNILLDSYEDVLYQIYTDDNVVEWVDKLNAEEDEAVTVNQLRRFLGGILYSKDYIKAITVITSGGREVTYDQMTAQTYQSSWLDSYFYGKDNMYREVSGDSQSHVFPTGYATSFANEDHYVFHIAHRIIDYRDLEKRSGIVVISLDIALLQEICEGKTEDGTENSFAFILNQDGSFVCYEDVSVIGTETIDRSGQTEEEREAYIRFLTEKRDYEAGNILLSVYEDEALGWTIVEAMDQGSVLDRIRSQLLVIVFVSVGLFAVAIGTTAHISGRLVQSVQTTVNTMKEIGQGNMDQRISVTRETPAEMETIALEFNRMLEKLKDATEKEKQAIEEQKDAQIKMLEAQVNPHFLYNTLDTINWMAIGQDAFDISNAINSLARILRYAISDSTGEVRMAEEIDWLKKYVYLQQFRLKEKFECRIQADADVMDCRVHKLLLQPFVENAIIHGFQGKTGKNILLVSVCRSGNMLKIRIQDNGVGISPEILRALNDGKYLEDKNKHHIGMKNAIMRMKMYYGDATQVKISGAPGAGTLVLLDIPCMQEETKQS